MTSNEEPTTFAREGDVGPDVEAAPEPQEAIPLEQESIDQPDDDESSAEEAIRQSLVTLGFVAFDSASADNTTTGALVSEERRAHFSRDVYVGIRDTEQSKEFLGRIVEGPFHSPHEIGSESAITRTTVLYPDRTRFRPSFYVSGSIEVLGEIGENERVTPSATRPRPYSEVYIYPSERLETMLGIRGSLRLGKLMGYEDVDVRADPASKNFLPRNVGVFGTVGSGKSNSVQVLMEEAVRDGWAVVVVDVEGEYVRMNEPTSDPAMAALLRDRFGLSPEGVGNFQVFVPHSGDSDAVTPTAFKVPISRVEPGIIASILELSEAQERMLTIVTHQLRRQAGRAPDRRLGVFGEEDDDAHPFTLQDLIDGLLEDANGNIPLLPQVRGPEKSTAGALRSKLIGLGTSNILDWNATRSVGELPVDELLVGGTLSVLDVAETDDRSRNIAISYMLQALFERVIANALDSPMSSGHPRPKVLVVIEEVHTFVSKAMASRMRAIIDQLQVISRRGRKRWMALALVSQQPGHVPDELFELVNTRFIHQLRSSSNLAPVRQTTGGVHEALWSTVPALGPGQCLLTSSVFRNPLFMDVRPALSRRMLID